MKIRRMLSVITIVLVIIMMTGVLSSCGDSAESTEPQDSAVTEETADTEEAEDTADTEEAAEPEEEISPEQMESLEETASELEEAAENEEAPEPEEEALSEEKKPEGSDESDAKNPEESTEPEDAATPGKGASSDKKKVLEIKDIDKDDIFDMPLQMKRIVLYDDGSLKIVPRDDLRSWAKKKGKLIDGAIYPFSKTGKVKDVKVMWVGNGGFRTVVCLMEDGTVSALDPTRIITKHRTKVIKRLADRDDFVSIEQLHEESAYGIIGVTKDGKEILLDEYLW